jgi:hypothetical protein
LRPSCGSLLRGFALHLHLRSEAYRIRRRPEVPQVIGGVLPAHGHRHVFRCLLGDATRRLLNGVDIRTGLRIREHAQTLQWGACLRGVHTLQPGGLVPCIWRRMHEHDERRRDVEVGTSSRGDRTGLLAAVGRRRARTSFSACTTSLGERNAATCIAVSAETERIERRDSERRIRGLLS